MQFGEEAPAAPGEQMEKDLNRLGVKQSKGNLSKKELSEKAKEYGMSVKDFKLEINKWHLNYNIRFEIAELENETKEGLREKTDKQTTIDEIIGYMRKSPERYQKELPFQDISLETTMKEMMPVASATPVEGVIEEEVGQDAEFTDDSEFVIFDDEFVDPEVLAQELAAQNAEAAAMAGEEIQELGAIPTQDEVLALEAEQIALLEEEAKLNNSLNKEDENCAT